MRPKWMADGGYGVVESIAILHTAQPMYNLTVDTAHTFFVSEVEVLVHNACSADDFKRVTRSEHGVRQQGNTDAGVFEMSSHEMEFVDILLDRKPNLEIYRTPDGKGMGDFVIIDRSNPESPVGWIAELKKPAGASQAGHQLRSAQDAANYWGLREYRVTTGNIDELVTEMSVGRSSWRRR